MLKIERLGGKIIKSEKCLGAIKPKGPKQDG